MKYTFETQRTYVTEVTIVANSKEEAWEWLYNNEQYIAEEEFKQMNVVHEESIMRVQSEEHDGSELYAKQRLEELRMALRSESMSYGELLELQCLSPYIDKGDVELLEASGVEEFSLHQLQTNFVGRTTSAYEYVGELNDLVGRNAFSCSTKRVDQSPQTEWIISGKDITSEEIERLNLHLDFIID